MELIFLVATTGYKTSWIIGPQQSIATLGVTGAESLINSRPLAYQSANPNDDVQLTSNHFLHGQVGGLFALETVGTTKFNQGTR